MRTAAIVNLKGGVGKSTTAINLALIMATVYKYRVLLVDNDIQANVSKFFGVHSYDYKSMENVLRDTDTMAEAESGSSWQQQIRTSLITGGDCMDFVPEESIKKHAKKN